MIPSSGGRFEVARDGQASSRNQTGAPRSAGRAHPPARIAIRCSLPRNAHCHLDRGGARPTQRRHSRCVSPPSTAAGTPRINVGTPGCLAKTKWSSHARVGSAASRTSGGTILRRRIAESLSLSHPAEGWHVRGDRRSGELIERAGNSDRRDDLDRWRRLARDRAKLVEKECGSSACRDDDNDVSGNDHTFGVRQRRQHAIGDQTSCTRPPRARPVDRHGVMGRHAAYRVARGAAAGLPTSSSSRDSVRHWARRREIHGATRRVFTSRSSSWRKARSR